MGWWIVGAIVGGFVLWRLVRVSQRGNSEAQVRQAASAWLSNATPAEFFMVWLCAFSLAEREAISGTAAVEIAQIKLFGFFNRHRLPLPAPLLEETANELDALAERMTDVEFLRRFLRFCETQGGVEHAHKISVMMRNAAEFLSRPAAPRSA